MTTTAAETAVEPQDNAVSSVVAAEGRPLLLLDVDGPLNPYAAKPTRRPEGYSTFRLSPTGWRGKSLRVWLNPDHGRLLLDVAQRVGLELAWATTWEHDANRLIGPEIGLPELPVIEFVLRGNAWKWDAVAEFAAGRPLVWLDDDFAVYGQLRTRFDLARCEAPTLLREIDPKVGITPADLAAVESWAKALL